MTLLSLKRGSTATVAGVRAMSADDPIARRLSALGFTEGEPVSVLAQGPLGGDPLIVQVGFTRFALRRTEAERVMLLGGTSAR
jgi:ferrous iron transport protein A